MTAGKASEPSPQERAAAAMGAIAGRALESNLRRVDELAEAMRSVRGGADDDLAVARAGGVAHQLVGSAGTFGFSLVSRLARQVEELFLDRAFSDGPRMAAASNALEEMRSALSAGPDDEDEED